MTRYFAAMVQVMAEAAEKGLLSYVEEFGVPGEYKRMLSRKKQDADAWVLAQEVIDEAEVSRS